MSPAGETLRGEVVSRLAEAAQDQRPVAGLTHNFYRYPARFSPQFASAAIECFSEPGELVLDPYMGGGTTVVEALAMGRRAIGNDLNSLATFVAKVKTTPLNEEETEAVRKWATEVVPSLTYHTPRSELDALLASDKTRNLTLLRGRFIKKVLAAGLATAAVLPTPNAIDFVRCAMLRVGQWALDGRRTQASLSDFRDLLEQTTLEMLTALDELRSAVDEAGGRWDRVLTNQDAGELDRLPVFAKQGERANLVVTSPPYPGIHVLYHRWQVDGRRETPAPYWIADCNDGEGGSYYNFGDRREKDATTYFASSLRTLRMIRRVMASGAVMVQMVAFNDPKRHLPRYLANMERAGFRELRPGRNRVWREVPNRRWHATLRGRTSSSREVVLVHRAS